MTVEAISRRQAVFGLVIALAVTYGAAALGGYATALGISSPWYATLQKPSWQPPGALFGPVWSLLYTMMAVSVWLVWRKCGSLAAARWPVALYGIQLALNVFWCFLFFAWGNPGAGLGEIVVLWLTILALTVVSWRVTPWAGVLLLPYLAWVSFASVLNAAIWRLNIPQ
jgi:translocator protein